MANKACFEISSEYSVAIVKTRLGQVNIYGIIISGLRSSQFYATTRRLYEILHGSLGNTIIVCKPKKKKKKKIVLETHYVD